MTAAGSGPARMMQASCVLVGRLAVLIRGAPGSGKSSLAAALLATADQHRPVRLVADDAVVLRAAGGRIVAAASQPVRGLVEMRGLGIVPVAYEPRAVVGLVVDLVDEGEVVRLPEPGDLTAEIAGVGLARLALPAHGEGLARRVLAALALAVPTGTIEAEPSGRASPAKSIRA